MYYMIGASKPSLHRESTDSLIFVAVYKLNNVLYCMCLPAFIVTSALMGMLLPEANLLLFKNIVYVVVLAMFCISYVYKLSWSLVLTSASYRYIHLIY